VCYNGQRRANANQWFRAIRRATLKRSFLLATLLFALSLALGTQVTSVESAEMLGDLSELIEPIESLSSLVLFLIIFLNNAIKTLGVIVFGASFGLPPFLFVTANGFVIGVLASGLESDAGYGVLIAGLAPHGVIEIPILLLATALGFTAGRESFKWLTGKESMVRSKLRQGLKVYFKWMVGGLFVAAVIEVFVTPHIIRLAGGYIT